MPVYIDGVNVNKTAPGEFIVVVLQFYNIPKEQRMLSQNIHKVCVFKKAKVDKDGSNHHLLATFLQPLMDDFSEMGVGITVFDNSFNPMQTLLRAHLTYPRSPT
jgi:hypothetical protein